MDQQTPRSARRLSHAEATQIEETQGRFCRGCRTLFPPDDVPTSFGLDKRTKGHFTVLCLACTARRDALSQKRVRAGRASSQAEYRHAARQLLIASSQAHLDERLALDPPRHAIPLCSMPGYPSTLISPLTPPPGSRDSAVMGSLYSKLRDTGMVDWDEIAGYSQRKIPDYFKIGARSVELINAHLSALDLSLLTP